ncbi:MAG: hypothetical protein KDK70_20450, partial [Myxococcales bacterium]|nr:hypothetical protein [Myxococcales bacterium]
MADPRKPDEAPTTRQEPPGASCADDSRDPSESQLGPAPAVAGSDRMRASLRARLFGDVGPAGAGGDAKGDPPD